jgi:hypothetical protein
MSTNPEALSRIEQLACDWIVERKKHEALQGQLQRLSGEVKQQSRALSEANAALNQLVEQVKSSRVDFFQGTNNVQPGSTVAVWDKSEAGWIVKLGCVGFTRSGERKYQPEVKLVNFLSLNPDNSVTPSTAPVTTSWLKYQFGYIPVGFSPRNATEWNAVIDGVCAKYGECQIANCPRATHVHA